MADGEVSLDFLINDEASGSVDKIVDHAIKGANTIDTSATKSASKVREEAEKTRSELDKQFGKETRVKLTTQFDKAGVKNFDETLEKLPKEKQIELLTKANKGELIDVEKEIKALPPTVKSEIELKDNASPEIKKVAALSKKDIHQKLVADADTHGIKNFDALLKKLPKKTQTQLLAKAENGEVINYEKVLRKLPSKVITDVQLKDNASPQLKKIQEEAEVTKSKFASFKSVMAGTFVGNLGLNALAKGMHLFTSSIGEAVSRVDTLNNSQRVFANIGISAKDASKGADDLKEAIHGLPTALDDATKHQQLLTSSMSGDIGNATKVFKALNDGILGFGGTTDQVNEAVTQLSQSFSNGKVDGQTWLSMINAGMGPALEAIGKKMGKTTGELQEGLSSGSISVKEFQNQLIEMDEKGGGGIASLGKISKDATKGMNTSFANLHSAMVRTTGAMLSEVAPQVTKSMGKMTDSLDAASPAFKAFGKGASSIFNGVINSMSGMVNFISKHQKDISSLFSSIADIGGALAGGAWDAAKGTISAIADAFSLMGGDVKKSHDPLKTTASLLEEVAKHKDAIRILGATIAGAFAVKKLAGFADGVRKINDSLKVTSGMKKIGGLFIKPKVDGSDAKRELGILGKAVKSTGSGIKKALKWTAKISTKAAIAALSGLKKAAVVTGSAMKTAFNFAKANPIFLIISVITALGVAFYELYKHNKKFKKFIDGIGKGIGKLFKSAGKTISNGIKSIQKAFKGVINFFKKDWKEILLFIVNPFTGAFALLYKHNTKFRNGINAVIKWFKTTLSQFGKWFSSSLNSFGKWYIKTWSKILEPIRDGFEAVFNFFGKIWNAWYKNFTHNMSALGKWLSKTWKNIWNPIKDFFSDTWDDIKKIGKKAWDWISDHLSGFGKSVSKTWHHLWDSVADFFGDTWNGIKKTGQRAWNWISDKLDDFGSNVSKGWRGLWNGLKDFFSDIWDDIKGLAKDGINGVIGFINGGITGINKIISNFGGGKDTISTIKPVKFAHGTKGAPRGLAMVNDGFDSPTGQELIIDNQGRGTILEGRNQLVNFEGGETVVPAGVTHAMLNGKFANGTNDWFGGLKNFFGDAAEDIDDMMKKATGKAAAFFNIVKNPIGYIQDKIFSPVTEGINNTKGSAIKALGNAFNSDGKGVQGNQNKWWKELWAMLKDTLSGGGKGGHGDDYLFKGKAKDDGSDPWGYYFRECVSFVASRLKNEGVNPKLFTGLGNGSQWGAAHVPHSSTPHVGDVAQYGAGSLYDNHVAIVTDVKGNKYREEGYNFGNPPNGKYYNSAQWHDASDASTFLRFPGAKGGKLSKNEEKKQSPLQKLIKKQVGGMFDWVENMVSSLMPSFTGPAGQAPSGDHKHWLSQAGIKGDFDKWNYIISHESGWNPHAKNPGSDAYGIGQALPPSKMAAFGSDYMSNPITQLKWMQSYVNERYGGINGAYDFWRSHNWYANGGWGGNKIGIFNEVPGEEEVAINPYRTTSDQHIAEVIDKRAQLAPNSPTAKLQSYAHAIKQDMTSESQTVRMGQSQQINNKPINGQLISLDELKGTEVSITTNLNGQAIAQETVDLITLLQSKNLQIDAYGSGQGGLLNG